MRNKTKTLFIGGAFACIGSLSGHGETFQGKLDAYFTEHREEIQKSIREWDVYNKNKQEYHITEQELKDVVMRSYKKTIDWMKLSMRHQIRFFGYYTKYLRKGDMASLKKRFDVEQIRIHALQDLDDMRKKFTQRGIDYPKLEKLYDACNSYQPDPNDPEGLKDHLLKAVGEDSKDVVAGGRRYYEHTSEDAYAIERLDDFWDGFLCGSNPDYNWTGEMSYLHISVYFHNDYCTYTKWNPVAYPANWCAAASPYPNFCLGEHEDAIDKMFDDEGLIRAYGKVMNLLPEYIDIACFLYGIYSGVFLEFREKKNPKTMEESEKISEVCKALSRSLDLNYIKIQDFLGAHTDFKVILQKLEMIRNHLLKLRRIIGLSAQ